MREECVGSERSGWAKPPSLQRSTQMCSRVHTLFAVSNPMSTCRNVSVCLATLPSGATGGNFACCANIALAAFPTVDGKYNINPEHLSHAEG